MSFGNGFMAQQDLDLWWIFGCLRFFVAKGFMETCLFLVIREHEGLALCQNGSKHGKIAEEVSKAWMTPFSIELSMVCRVSILVGFYIFIYFLR